VEPTKTRIGLVSGRGLASVLRHYYSRRVLWFACLLLLTANTVNIAADLGGMAAVAELMTGVPSLIFTPLFAGVILLLLVFSSYRPLVQVFKWLTLALFAYVITAFLVHPDWTKVMRATFSPRVSFTSDYLMTFIAILGTTISPYLFFWQAAEEVEEEKKIGKMTVGRSAKAQRVNNCARCSRIP